MKHLLFLLVISVHQAEADVTPPAARIARFSGDRPAAVSYTFDDGTRDQFTLAVPMLNEVGFKGTFFVIPGSVAETLEEAERKQDLKRAWGSITWTELKEMAGQDHEIASHTWSHRNLTKFPAEEVDAEFSKASEAIETRIGRAPLTLAFPFNQSSPEVRRLALEKHVACRDDQLGMGEKTTLASLDAWADKQVRDGTWGVLMAHAIGRGYAALVDPEIFRNHLRHVKARERGIWVDTFANVARYVKERDATKLELAGSPGNVTCRLSCPLDMSVYNIPLTVVIEAPGAISPHAEQAGKELHVSVRDGAISFDAIPGGQPVRVTWK